MQVGTQLSAAACGPRERTSPHHLTHQLTARTTAMTTCSAATTIALVACSLETAIALSNGQVTWAGHTLTALKLQHPHLLLSLQTGLSSLEERIPHLSEGFERTSHVPTPQTNRYTCNKPHPSEIYVTVPPNDSLCFKFDNKLKHKRHCVQNDLKSYVKNNFRLHAN